MGRKVKRECPVCGAEYRADETRIKHGRETTCSRPCSYKLRAASLTTAATLTCAVCAKEFTRSQGARKAKHGAEYCSRACHYSGRAAGLTPRVVVDGYKISDESRAESSSRAARMYADGRGFPIPENETRVSAALGALGIGHVHQHVIDLGKRSVSVDFYFESRKLVIEIDEPSLHRKLAAKDRRRDADLVAAGYSVRRVLDDGDVRAITARVLGALS